MRWLVIFAVVILAVPIAAQGTIVIVSDSACDVAMAELLASVMEAKIVKVEWGQFDEDVIEDVVEEDPDNIIIIGGNKAVVDQIQELLERLGFSIFRAAGKDRAETSLELYKAFQEYFNDDFAVVVVDTNRVSIYKGKRLAIKHSVPLFFCDVSELDDMLTEISELGIEEVRIITSNRQSDLRTTCEKRLEEVQERLEKIEEQLKGTVTEEDTEATEEDTDITEEEEEDTDITEEEKLLEECKMLLQKATEAFEDGNYLLCLQYLTDIETLLNELEG